LITSTCTARHHSGRRWCSSEQPARKSLPLQVDTIYTFDDRERRIFNAIPLNLNLVIKGGLHCPLQPQQNSENQKNEDTANNPCDLLDTCNLSPLQSSELISVECLANRRDSPQCHELNNKHWQIALCDLKANHSKRIQGYLVIFSPEAHDRFNLRHENLLFLITLVVSDTFYCTDSQLGCRELHPAHRLCIYGHDHRAK
jgi:hypothetical protein